MRTRTLAALTFLAAGITCQAGIITYDFSGTIGFSAVTGISVGDPFSGSFSYDTSTMPFAASSDVANYNVSLPFTVTIDGLTSFGGDKPRAIVARVKADPALMDLQAEQERRLRRIGLEPEARKFTPHVTLARLRGVGQAAVADYLAARGALAAEAFIAERFVLFSARDGTGGGPYVVEAAYPLG